MRYAMLACLLPCLVACGSKSAPAPTEPASPSAPAASGSASAECVVTGCSKSVCAKAGTDVITTCEMKSEYQCYAGAECKVQANGECGWTQDAKLTSCIASPPAMQ